MDGEELLDNILQEEIVNETEATPAEETIEVPEVSTDNPRSEDSHNNEDVEAEQQICSSCGAPFRMVKTRNLKLSKRFRFRIYQKVCTSVICGKTLEKHYKLVSGKFEHSPDVDLMSEMLNQAALEREKKSQERNEEMNSQLVPPKPVVIRRRGRKSEQKLQELVIKDDALDKSPTPMISPMEASDDDSKTASVMIQTEAPPIESLIDLYFAENFSTIARENPLDESTLIHPRLKRKLIFYHRIVQKQEEVIKCRDETILKLNQQNELVKETLKSTKLVFMDEIQRAKDLVLVMKSEFKAHHLEVLAETRKNINKFKKESAIFEAKCEEMEKKMKVKEKELQVEKIRVDYEQERADHFMREKEMKDRSETIARVAHKEIEKKLADSLYIASMSHCPHCQSNEKLKKKLMAEVAECTMEMEKAQKEREMMSKQLKKSERSQQVMQTDMQKLQYESRTWKSMSDKHHKTIELLNEELSRFKRNGKKDFSATPSTPAENSNTPSTSFTFEEPRKTETPLQQESGSFSSWIPKKPVESASVSSSPRIPDKIKAAQNEKNGSFLNETKRKGPVEQIARASHLQGTFGNSAPQKQDQRKPPVNPPPVKKFRSGPHNHQPPVRVEEARQRPSSPQIRKFGDEIMGRYDQRPCYPIPSRSPGYGEPNLHRQDVFARDPPVRSHPSHAHFRANSPVYQRFEEMWNGGGGGAPQSQQHRDTSLPWHRGSGEEGSDWSFQPRNIGPPPRESWESPHEQQPRQFPGPPRTNWGSRPAGPPPQVEPRRWDDPSSHRSYWS